MFCPYCRKKGVDNLSVCPQCGKPLENVESSSGAACSNCGRSNPRDAVFCSFCGLKFEEKTTSDSVPTKRSNTIEPQKTLVGSFVSKYAKPTAVPKLTIVFYIVGVLEIIGGLILCMQLWPNPKELGYRSEYESTAYVPALTWLFAGLISGFLFFAVGEVLKYLHYILGFLTSPYYIKINDEMSEKFKEH